MSDYENRINELIEAFSSYREIMEPLQESLRNVANTYDSIRDSLDTLNNTFVRDGGMQMDKVQSMLASQAKSGQVLAERISTLNSVGERYTSSVGSLVTKLAEVEKRLSTVEEMEKNAEKILDRLEKIVEEKKNSYNLRDLQKSLENYNKNVERVSDFINKDVAQALSENGKKIEAIRSDYAALNEAVSEQNKSIAELVASFRETNNLLRKTVEKGSVNEEYLYDVLDKWANDRKIKLKKK